MKVKVTQSCLTLCHPMDYRVHGILQARLLEWVAYLFSRGSSQPRDWTKSPTLQANSLTAEPQGKPKNTAVGSLSFYSRFFQPRGLLHCSKILYQLSYLGNSGGSDGKESTCSPGNSGPFPGLGSLYVNPCMALISQ